MSQLTPGLWANALEWGQPMLLMLTIGSVSRLTRGAAVAALARVTCLKVEFAPDQF
eukprot:gene6725-36227_t